MNLKTKFHSINGEVLRLPPSVDSVFQVLSDIYDPELRKNLADSGLVKKEWISIDKEDQKISIEWKPTIPGCPLVVHITAAVKRVVENRYPNYTAIVRIKKGTPAAEDWNKKLSKKGYLEKIGEKLQGSQMWEAIVQTQPS